MLTSFMLTAVSNILFPVECGVCNGNVDINNKFGVCKKCYNDLEVINSAGCKYCGRPVEGFFCNLCNGKESNINKIYTACYYSGNIKKIIINFKFNKKRYLGKILGELLSDLFRLNLKAEKIDFIVPVPLSSLRRKMRGYNQAEILCKYLSKKTGMKIGKNIIIRTIDTRPQYTLKRGERFENIQGAFKASKKIQGKSVLLIDDIATTGATLQNSASALKESGAGKIFSLLIAHGK